MPNDYIFLKLTVKEIPPLHYIISQFHHLKGNLSRLELMLNLMVHVFVQNPMFCFLVYFGE